MAESFDDAKNYAESKRPIEPVNYNPNSRSNSENTASNPAAGTADSNVEVSDTEISTNDSVFLDDNLHPEYEIDNYNANASDTDDIKPILPTVVLSEAEQAMYGQMFDENESTNDESSDDEHQNEVINISPGGTKRITRQFSDGMEMTSEVGATIQPELIGYQVKKNDIISGNIPFDTNVSVLVLVLNSMLSEGNVCVFCYIVQ